MQLGWEFLKPISEITHRLTARIVHAVFVVLLSIMIPH